MKRETNLELGFDPISLTSQEFDDARDYVEHQISWLTDFSNMVDATFFDKQGSKIEIRTNKIYLADSDETWRERDQSKVCRWKPLDGAREAAASARYLREAVLLMGGLTGNMTNDHWLIIEAAFRAGGHSGGSQILNALKVKTKNDLIVITEKGASFDRKGREKGVKNKPKDWQEDLKKELGKLRLDNPLMRPCDIFESLRSSGHIKFENGKYRFKNAVNWSLKKSINDKIRSYWKGV